MKRKRNNTRKYRKWIDGEEETVEKKEQEAEKKEKEGKIK